MKRGVKINRAGDNKPAVAPANGGKIASRLDELEKARRIAQGLLKVLDKLHAEESARIHN
jgi:hypothetical protein